MKKVLSILASLLMTLHVIGQNSEAMFNEAEDLFANGMYDEANAIYSKVIAADPDNMNAYLRRGFCNSVMNRYDKAIEDFTTVIDKHADHPFAYISRGSAQNKLGKFQAGLADFDRALNLDPKNQEAYNNRGWSKNGMGLFDEACKDWNTSKKLGNEEAKLILKNNHCK
jgi:tetratricopeptide (TPR) repeat protein